jgi:hypothetical protein
MSAADDNKEAAKPNHSMIAAILPTIRPPKALALKFRGHPDLLNTEIRTLQNYWLKITGDSVMHTRNVKPHMINGQGRWRLHAQDPPEMVFKYCQSLLEEKLETSNF